MSDALAIWHRAISTKDVQLLSDVLADDIVFKPPTYWKTREGKPTAMLLLGNVIEIFENFEYHREWIDGDNWALEFSANIGELSLKGVDLMHVEDGVITELEVLIRPPSAVEALKVEMGKRLAALGMM